MNPGLLRTLTSVALFAALFLQSPGPADALFGFGKRAAVPGPTAAVGSVEGLANHQAKGMAKWTSVRAGQRLLPGDSIKTASDGKVVVAFSDGSKSLIGPNSNFALETLEPRKIGIELALGTLEAWVSRVSGRRFQTRTPTAVASVRGTVFRVEVDPSGQCTFDLFGGGLDVANSQGQSVALNPGQRVETDASAALSKPEPTPATVTPTPEPEVPIPAPTEAKPETKASEPAKEQEKRAADSKGDAASADETASGDESAADQTPPPPPPNPIQDTETVSPSSP